MHERLVYEFFGSLMSRCADLIYDKSNPSSLLVRILSSFFQIPKSRNPSTDENTPVTNINGRRNGNGPTGQAAASAANRIAENSQNVIGSLLDARALNQVKNLVQCFAQLNVVADSYLNRQFLSLMQAYLDAFSAVLSNHVSGSILNQPINSTLSNITLGQIDRFTQDLALGLCVALPNQNLIQSESLRMHQLLVKFRSFTVTTVFVKALKPKPAEAHNSIHVILRIFEQLLKNLRLKSDWSSIFMLSSNGIASSSSLTMKSRSNLRLSNSSIIFIKALHQDLCTIMGSLISLLFLVFDGFMDLSTLDTTNQTTRSAYLYEMANAFGDARFVLIRELIYRVIQEIVLLLLTVRNEFDELLEGSPLAKAFSILNQLLVHDFILLWTHNRALDPQSTSFPHGLIASFNLLSNLKTDYQLHCSRIGITVVPVTDWSANRTSIREILKGVSPRSINSTPAAVVSLSNQITTLMQTLSHNYRSMCSFMINDILPTLQIAIRSSTEHGPTGAGADSILDSSSGSTGASTGLFISQWKRFTTSLGAIGLAYSLSMDKKDKRVRSALIQEESIGVRGVQGFSDLASVLV
eukprot:GILK01017053.1.p1 GENE.GILK01017053.1~~GILK01017053.1.p1  ORF type:complete len:656 (+),score=143.24 GILK01017053.1:226-1968(+)